MSRIARAALVIFIAHPAAAQGPAPPRLLGCYEVKLGAWQPALDLGPDTVFIQPPVHFELLGDTGTSAMERARWLVRPAPRATPGRHRFSSWRLSTADSVELIWTTGFSGLRIVVASATDTLRGRAETFWDFDRARQRAAAELVRAPCGGGPPAAGRPETAQGYLDESGHVRVSLAQQPLSPNGRSTEPARGDGARQQGAQRAIERGAGDPVRGDLPAISEGVGHRIRHDPIHRRGRPLE